jgi:antitoxin HigA-1
MQMYDPPHPGKIIREDCLEPLGLTVTATAKGLGVSRQTLSELVNGRNGISADMAIRLEKAGWSTAERWMRAQLAYDLWPARLHAYAIQVQKFPTVAPASP